MLIRAFDPDADDQDVPDPYYGTATDFDDVVTMVRDTIPGLREYLIRRFPQA